MKKHSKSETAKKLALTKKQSEVSPIELHLERAAEIDALHQQIDKIDTKLAALLHQRAQLVAEL